MTQPASLGIRVLRILIGLILMAAFVLTALYLVTQRAGGWGVPYFSFTSDRGSPCVNTMTGFRCEPLTLADVTFYGDVNLPADTSVTSGTYVSTHDYQLDASLEVPAASAADALKSLQQTFGRCGDQAPPINTQGLSDVCVMGNGDDIVEIGEPDSRIFTVATGLHADGSRTISLSVRSR